MPLREYALCHRRTLLRTAREAIRQGLGPRHPPEIDLENVPAPLQEARSCFVTLTSGGQLRGCIGSLEPHRPLVRDVAHNAFDSAFSDPRFQAVRPDELQALDIEISVLSPISPMWVANETQLLEEIRPHVDGVVLEDGWRRATFLPKVWETLDTPASFIGELKRKAGMPIDYWSSSMRVYRYHTETFGERDLTGRSGRMRRPQSLRLGNKQDK